LILEAFDFASIFRETARLIIRLETLWLGMALSKCRRVTPATAGMADAANFAGF
jgi:hypothetical protein